MNKQSIIISLGGSIIVPDEINITFLKKFRLLILQNLKKYNKIVIVAGGGKICRKYQAAAKKIIKLPPTELDWIGISATKLNAELVRALFVNSAYPLVISEPKKKIKTDKKIIIGSGSVPGSSSDLDAIYLAENFGAKKVVNLSNISYVYTKDPRKFKEAKPIKKITWSEFKKVIGTKFRPGMNAPFDPVAAKRAEKKKISVIVMKGTDLRNFTYFLKGKSFKGTVII